jgi:UDP-glucose 4-epimerase
MGMTKALMEKVAQAAARRLSADSTVVTSVRYGNVMYSRGSVIPLFVRQILKGEPITVTEPSMTRFMLPLSYAVDLVFFALQHAEQGDVFVKKAPACTIADLVAALKELFGVDNEVQVIGMRHGEKIYETLASAEELRNSEDMGDYYRLSMDTRELNYARYFTEGDPDEINEEDYHSHNTERLSIDQVKDLLTSLPEIREALAGS